jgi:hypothetical protein
MNKNKERNFTRVWLFVVRNYHSTIRISFYAPTNIGNYDDKEFLVWTDTPVKDESERVTLQSRLNAKQSTCDKCEHNIYSQVIKS